MAQLLFFAARGFITLRFFLGGFVANNGAIKPCPENNSPQIV